MTKARLVEAARQAYEDAAAIDLNRAEQAGIAITGQEVWVWSNLTHLQLQAFHQLSEKR